MALSASSLATEIENGVRTSQSLGSTSYPQLTSYCQALATAIVNHIKNNAEFNAVVVSGQTAIAAAGTGGAGSTDHQHGAGTLTVAGGIK